MVKVVGIGPGNKDLITLKALNEVKSAEVLIGGARNLEIFKDLNCEKLEVKNNLKEILDYIKKNQSEKNICVIASGDPMLYGIGKYISEKNSGFTDIESGISSIQYMFSKIQVNMNDIYITSSHGKQPDFDYLLSHKKVAMVTDNLIGPKQISEEIIKRNLKKTIYVGENLSYENEKITIASAKEILDMNDFEMSVVVILDA